MAKSFLSDYFPWSDAILWDSVCIFRTHAFPKIWIIQLWDANLQNSLAEAARHLREDILNSDDEEREYFLKPRDRPYKLDSVIETKKTYEHVTNHGFKLCHDFTKDYAEIRR